MKGSNLKISHSFSGVKNRIPINSHNISVINNPIEKNTNLTLPVISSDKNLLAIEKINSYNSNFKTAENQNFSVGSKITPIALLLALGLHGFFEGIAFGLQKKYSESFYIFIAIISHKWAETLSLGIAFYKSRYSTLSIIFLITLFSLISPLGAILGIILSELSHIIEVIFLSLCTGNFLIIKELLFM